MQKLESKVTQGEVLIKEIAEGSSETASISADAMSSREAKMLKKKAKEAIRAASIQELSDKSEEVSERRVANKSMTALLRWGEPSARRRRSARRLLR